MTTMSPFTLLIVLLLAQVHDDLLGARVQHVEELSVLGVQTTAREVIDASQSVDQFPVGFTIIFLSEFMDISRLRKCDINQEKQ